MYSAFNLLEAVFINDFLKINKILDILPCTFAVQEFLDLSYLSLMCEQNQGLF